MHEPEPVGSSWAGALGAATAKALMRALARQVVTLLATALEAASALPPAGRRRYDYIVS